MEKTCKVCGSLNVHKVLDFGSMPSANNLVTKDELNSVKSYPLAYYWCGDCTFFQQIEMISREQLFGGFYVYQTGVSSPAVKHFEELARNLKEKIAKRDFAVVVASNDGTEIEMIKNFGGFGKVIGVEPNDLADIANSRGLHTIKEFFGKDTASRIVDVYGKADLVVANNVFAHIPDPIDFLSGMKMLLNDGGRIVVEVHWLKSLIDDLQIDALYGEHYYVWSAKAMHTVANVCGLKISEMEYLEGQHGGSIRTTFCLSGIGKELEAFYAEERRSGIYDAGSMKELQKRADERRDRFVKLIEGLRAENKNVSVWAVPAKIVTLLNYSGMSDRQIKCAYDNTPTKIGRFIPVANIRIKDEKEIVNDMPDCLIVGAWNYLDFAKKKFGWYLERGGILIDPLKCEIIRK